tara:strand:+ start:4795 stop:5211 length:417 start_codon:yes stop_codon:yes gene_type:complete
MEKIYSKVEPTKLLHIVQRVDKIKEPRVDLIPEEHFIQCSTLKMENGKTFKPHKHIWKNRTRDVIAQESWIVIKGKVKCIFYDINDQIIATPILNPGDASFTLEGGHTYEILEDNTLVYEYKTGPYEGQALDKTFIES